MSPPPVRRPSATSASGRKVSRVGAGDQRLRRQRRKRREQRRAASGSRCTAGSSSSSRGAEPRASAITAAWRQDQPDQQRLLLSGAGQRGGGAGCGIGQRHVGAMRAQRRGARRGVARAVGRQAGAQPVLHRHRWLGSPGARRSGRPGRSVPRGTRPPRRLASAAFSRPTRAMRAAVAATAWRAISSSRPASQDGSQPPPGRPSWSKRLRLPMAASCAAISRAWPGSSAQTSRSRKRRRPDRPSRNSRSICGVSQTAAMRAAISAWLRGAAPSRRNTRRCPGSGVGCWPAPAPGLARGLAPGLTRGWRAGADIGLALGCGEAASHRPTAGRAMALQVGGPRAAQAAAGTSSDTASSRLVLPLPFGPNSTAIRAARPPGQRRVAAEVGQRQTQQLHAGSICGRGAGSVNGGRVRSASWWSKMHGRRPWPATNLFTRGGPFHSWRACSLVAGCADVLHPFLRKPGGVPLAIELVALRAAPYETLAEQWPNGTGHSSSNGSGVRGWSAAMPMTSRMSGSHPWDRSWRKRDVGTLHLPCRGSVQS